MMEILPSILTPVLVNCIAVVGLYVIAASGRISAGHAAFFGIGGYASGVLSKFAGLPPLVSIVLGMFVAAAVGAAFALIADRLSHWFFAVATLAFAVMVLSLVATIEAVGGATGLYGIPIVVGLPGLHAWPVAACGGMSIGHRGMLYASKALAATMIDLYSNARLRDEIRAEFTKKTAGVAYKSYIPEGPPPVPEYQ